MSIWALIYTRVQWGALFVAGFGDRSANYPLREVWTHHTVMTHLSPNATVAQEMAEMRRIERVGQDRFGRGISYNFVIFPSGRIYMGLGASRIGAHTGGRNSISLSVAFAGNYETNRPTTAALATYELLLRDFHKEGIVAAPRTNGGHRDAPGHSSNACAGRHLQAELPGVNTRASRPAVTTAAPAAPKPAASKPVAKPAAAPPGSYADRTGWPERPVVQRINDQLWEDNAYESTKFALVEALRRAGYGTDSVTAWGRLQQISRWLRGRHNLRGPETQVEIWKRFQTYLKSVNRYAGAIDGIPGPITVRGIFGWLNDIRSAYL
ncbi:N-acetylmuramoyl-L-alanine amidase [Nesterenkonia aurantiaca]|uniref:N-acetylmuramoyl-L-alanine amidase n=1 Tax=Nesterenkonia aurantiaca TaxID=1436010 RepID=UPI003EE727A0